MTTNNLNLSNYDELTIDFSYYTVSIDNSDEDFWLQISTDGENTFNTIEKWNHGDKFNNDQRYSEQVLIDNIIFTSTTQLRFRCDASGNGDKVYIDDVIINGCLQSSAAKYSNRKLTSSIFEEEISKVDDSLTSYKLYPNPAKHFVNIELKNLEKELKTIVILDTTGKVIIKQESFEKDTNELRINLENINSGIYYMQLIALDNSLLTTMSLVIE